LNLPSILIGLAILGVFLAIVARGVYNRRRGKGGCSCGGNCESCGGCSACHPDKQN